MSTILVTGASGLIGHALATRLSAEGRNVIGLDRRPPRAGGASFPFVEAELNDVHRLYAAVRGREPAGIVHCGGVSGLTQCFIREMITDALAGRAARLPHARRSRRQYVYITDVVDAIVLALDAEAPPRRAYNVGPGRQHSLGEVADAVRDVMGPLEVKFDDSCDPREYKCGTLDIAAARDLGWRPKIDLPAGIGAYAQFLRAASG